MTIIHSLLTSVIIITVCVWCPKNPLNQGILRSGQFDKPLSEVVVLLSCDMKSCMTIFFLFWHLQKWNGSKRSRMAYYHSNQSNIIVIIIINNNEKSGKRGECTRQYWTGKWLMVKLSSEVVEIIILTVAGHFSSSPYLQNYSWCVTITTLCICCDTMIMMMMMVTVTISCLVLINWRSYAY